VSLALYPLLSELCPARLDAAARLAEIATNTQMKTAIRLIQTAMTAGFRDDGKR
jgi:hypothetical protein